MLYFIHPSGFISISISINIIQYTLTRFFLGLFIGLATLASCIITWLHR